MDNLETKDGLVIRTTDMEDMQAAADPGEPGRPPGRFSGGLKTMRRAVRRLSRITPEDRFLNGLLVLTLVALVGVVAWRITSTEEAPATTEVRAVTAEKVVSSSTTTSTTTTTTTAVPVAATPAPAPTVAPATPAPTSRASAATRRSRTPAPQAPATVATSPPATSPPPPPPPTSPPATNPPTTTPTLPPGHTED